MAGSAPPPREPSGARSQTSRFAIVAARFNEGIVTRLVEGARHAFVAAKVPDEAVELHWVPGSFELPLAALRLAETRRYAGIVCVGVVIRGETPHFDYVAGECAAGLARIADETGVPVAFGVLTTENEEQALERAGGSEGNKGADAAHAAIELANLLRKLG
jgi:6,7-dimethyl-8-ribityllumazine synthase